MHLEHTFLNKQWRWWGVSCNGGEMRAGIGGQGHYPGKGQRELTENDTGYCCLHWWLLFCWHRCHGAMVEMPAAD